MSTEGGRPGRGEIWRVDFDPTIGTEIRKIRPAVVISSDAIGKLPVKLVAPITGWNDSFRSNPWHVRIEPDAQNGLTKTLAVDTLQVRGVDTQRFTERLGVASSNIVEEIVAALAAVIEYEG